MYFNGRPNLAKGVIAGVAGGIVASWVMDVYLARAGKKLQRAAKKGNERTAARQHEEQGAPSEDATVKTANAVSHAMTGHELTPAQKRAGGPFVHYAFGAAMGGVYGALAEVSPLVTAGFGSAFGSALFTGADLIAVPALKLGSSPASQPISSLTAPSTAHIVYGATTELFRRVMRALL